MESGTPEKATRALDTNCFKLQGLGPSIAMFAGDWIDWAENLLLFSPSGVRKTHRAAGICRSLMAMDRSGRFFTATTLVQ